LPKVLGYHGLRRSSGLTEPGSPWEPEEGKPMSRSRHIVLILIAGTVLPAAAQTPAPPGPKAPPRFSQLVSLPASDELEGQLEAAPSYSRAGRWAEAIRALQAVLENPEDSFVCVRRPGPGGKDVLAWVSARAEANRLLGTLPTAGREVYEINHGGQAALLLNE